MIPLTEYQLQRIAFLARETLVEFWHRFVRERGLPPLTAEDIDYMLAADRADYPDLIHR